MRPRVLNIDSVESVREALKMMRVSPEGIDIMSPKGIHRLVQITGIDCRAANIIKQEMLARGGEAAAPYELYMLDARKIDMLLMGTAKQFEALLEKLSRQPFGLPALAGEIKKTLESYTKKPPTLHAGRFALELASRTHVMGILNITPDSFSDGGLYLGLDDALRQARRMVSEGADIIDVGGESTRPGAVEVGLDEELKRVIPLIERLSAELDVPVSIDTYKPEVARSALDAGASLINDISGLRDGAMAALAAERNVPVVIMHMKGTPRDMQDEPVYGDVVAEVIDWLDGQARQAMEAGVAEQNIVVDPGIGFGKTLEHNLELLRRLSEFKSLGFPILIGTSRKAFIGKILDAPADERLEGTLATIAYAVSKGAGIVRVHDVREARRAVAVVDAITGRTGS